MKTVLRVDDTLKNGLCGGPLPPRTLEHFRFVNHVKIKSYVVTASLGHVPFNVKRASFGLRICETH